MNTPVALTVGQARLQGRHQHLLDLILKVAPKSGRYRHPHILPVEAEGTCPVGSGRGGAAVGLSDRGVRPLPWLHLAPALDPRPEVLSQTVPLALLPLVPAPLSRPPEWLPVHSAPSEPVDRVPPETGAKVVLPRSGYLVTQVHGVRAAPSPDPAETSLPPPGAL